MKTIQELATHYASLFITKQRIDGESFICVENVEKDTNLQDLIRNAHNDMLPDDYKYEYILNALNLIPTCENEEELEDCVINIETDIYTNNLIKWLGSNLNRQYYCNEAIEEGIAGDNIISIITAGQCKERTEVYYSVKASLEGIIELMNSEVSIDD